MSRNLMVENLSDATLTDRVAETPLQDIEFDPITRTEIVVPANDISTRADLAILDRSLANAGFEGMNDLLASLGTPKTFAGELTGATNESIAPRSVFGPDDRVQITNTTAFPWSAVGQVRMQFSDGNWYQGSGAMISPYHFLTAGHNIHNGTLGWAEDIEISLGRDGDEQFYGVADWTYVRTYNGWTDSEDPNHDWALVTLDRNVGNFTGWFGYESRGNSSDYDGMTVNTAGYPGDFGGEDMYWATGTVDRADDRTLYYNGTLDTFAGQSGSAVWRYDSSANQRYINAVHVRGGSQFNEGTRIDGEKFDSLESWIADDDSVRTPVDRPDLVDYDNWFDTDFAYFSADPVSPGETFTARAVVRNNGTATANNFTVSFYASTNTNITTFDYSIGSVTISSVDPFNWSDAVWTGSFPNIPEGNYYLGWIIDSTNTQTEFLENNNRGVIGNTLLTVEASEDTYEPNNTLATAYNLSSHERTWLDNLGGLGVAADNDWYKIEITPGYERLLVDLRFTHADGDIDLRVYDRGGNLVASSTSITDNEFIDTLLPSSGTYYLRIYPYNGSGNTYDLWWDDIRSAQSILNRDTFADTLNDDPLIGVSSELVASDLNEVDVLSGLAEADFFVFEDTSKVYNEDESLASDDLSDAQIVDFIDRENVSSLYTDATYQLSAANGKMQIERLNGNWSDLVQVATGLDLNAPDFKGITF